MIDSASHSTPTRHQLLAALRAAAALGHGVDAASVNESYLRLPTEGVYDRNDLQRGAALLQQLGLVTETDGRLAPDVRLHALLALEEDAACELLLALVVEQSNPLWLQTAAGGEGAVAEELLPDAVQRVLQSVVPDVEAREALLLSLANKFDATDQEERAERGRKGEEFVVRACSTELTNRGRADLADGVRHVSLISDQLGYDVVTPDLAGHDVRLEVKTTRQPAGADAWIFLSRNEARAGSRDSRWRLVLCNIAPGDVVTIIGSCAFSVIAAFLPTDSARGKWAVCRLMLPTDALDPGLAFLSPM